MILKVYKTEQYQTELEVLDKLKDHEGFPKVISTLKTSNHMEVLMPMLGESMLDVFQEFPLKKIDENKFFKVCAQVVSRLQTLHEVGYIHNDLKPENILISPDHSTVYLIDFGLAEAYINQDGSHKSQEYTGIFMGN